MTIRRSTFLRESLLDTNDLKTLLAAGFIEIRSGTQPTSADDAITGTLLAIIYSNHPTDTTGISFAAAIENVMSKTGTWSGVAVATGTAGYFRYYQFDTSVSTSQTNGRKDDSSSKDNSRFDGSISTSGADMNLTSVAIVSGVVLTIDTFSITFPEA